MCVCLLSHCVSCVSWVVVRVSLFSLLSPSLTLIPSLSLPPSPSLLHLQVPLSRGPPTHAYACGDEDEEEGCVEGCPAAWLAGFGLRPDVEVKEVGGCVCVSFVVVSHSLSPPSHSLSFFASGWATGAWPLCRGGPRGWAAGGGVRGGGKSFLWLCAFVSVTRLTPCCFSCPRSSRGEGAASGVTDGELLLSLAFPHPFRV